MQDIWRGVTASMIETAEFQAFPTTAALALAAKFEIVLNDAAPVAGSP
jgi:hypothetical protein